MFSIDSVNVAEISKKFLQGDWRLMTILQLGDKCGVLIPRFCYHNSLSIAGNCRMCLVQIGNLPKLGIACSLTPTPGFDVSTKSAVVKKAREAVLEFLLINHPLDCPICDQGGECDLQDQTIVFGADRGRFYEKKRAVSELSFGPMIKTFMSRCIHCTRCVRFFSEVLGLKTLGMVGRGSLAKVSGFVNFLDVPSLLSGNVADVCPVGALTHKPYSFTSRSWELSAHPSVDFFDVWCPPIKVEGRNGVILRVSPRVIESSSMDPWITDKIRLFFDGLDLQRCYSPKLFGYNFQPGRPTGWPKFLSSLENFFKRFYAFTKFSSGLHLTNPSVDIRVHPFFEYNFSKAFSFSDLCLPNHRTAKPFLVKFLSFRRFFLNFYSLCSTFIKSSKFSYSLSQSLYPQAFLFVFCCLAPSFETPLLGAFLRKFSLTNKSFSLMFGPRSSGFHVPVTHQAQAGKVSFGGISALSVLKFVRGKFGAGRFFYLRSFSLLDKSLFQKFETSGIAFGFFLYGAGILPRADSVLKIFQITQTLLGIDRVSLLPPTPGFLNMFETGSTLFDSLHKDII